MLNNNKDGCFLEWNVYISEDACFLEWNVDWIEGCCEQGSYLTKGSSLLG
jgi:hypothetical protein